MYIPSKILIDYCIRCIMKYEDNFTIVDTLWSPQDFRLINFQDATEKGVCYGNTKQTWVTLHNHKSMNDLIITSIEESLHQAINDDSYGMPNETESMDVEHEEELVKRLFWCINDWI